MKKVLFIAIVGLVTFTSCKKDWTCTCTYDGSTGSVDYKDTKKSDAKESCNAYETLAKLSDPSASCSID